METQVSNIEPQSGKFPQAVIWIAGIALTLFCGVGIAALMGWIPNSMGGPGDGAAMDQRMHQRRAARFCESANACGIAFRSGGAYRSRAGGCSGDMQRMRRDRVGARNRHQGQGSGLGAVGGAVVGGLLGNQVGGGRGKDVMTVVGAVGGGVAGNEVEKRVKATKSYEVTVRLNDGSSRVISEASVPAWRTGTKSESSTA